jgi:tetratricopeptide (TPR) repeat protein
VRTCATCGEKISASVGECLYCPPGAAAAPAPDAAASAPTAGAAASPAVSPSAPAAAPATPPPAPTLAPKPDAFELHHEAETALERGEVEKALVIASKAVKLWPQSIAARALYERARRELLRGLRRERLDARVQEARRKMEAGDFAGAEKIAVSALKLIPDHADALALFGTLKGRRLTASGVEAEAERELARLSARQARGAVLAAHAAIANGWERRALLAVRRGLRLVPDDAELLALLRELQGAEEDQDPQRAHRRALQSQVRAAVVLLRDRRLEESLAMLRAVLREDPDNVRAQEAVQQVRRAWLRRTAPPVPRVAPDAAPPAPDPVPPPRAPARASPPVPAPAAPPSPAPPTPAPLASSRPPLRSAARDTSALLAARRAAVPAGAPGGGVRVPRAAAWAAAAAVVLALVVAGLLRANGSRSAPESVAAPALVGAAPSAEPTAPAVIPEGPLAAVDAGLRTAVEAALAAYGDALERQDEASLARARPDLTDRERTALLQPFRGALNVGVDLRVLDVAAGPDAALVTVLRTDVIVDGRGGARAPVEEVLRFVRRSGAWAVGGPR